MKAITYDNLSAGLSGLSVHGSQAGTGLSVSQIVQAHQLMDLMDVVFEYAVKAGLAAKNIAAKINRRRHLAETCETEQYSSTHAPLPDFGPGNGTIEILMLVLEQLRPAAGEAASLRRETFVTAESPSGLRLLTLRDKELSRQTTDQTDMSRTGD